MVPIIVKEVLGGLRGEMCFYESDVIELRQTLFGTRIATVLYLAIPERILEHLKAPGDENALRSNYRDRNHVAFQSGSKCVHCCALSSFKNAG